MKSSISGWKDVLSFTLVQVLKTKAYRISFFLLVLLVLISMPLSSLLLFSNSEDENAPIPVDKVYVYNKTSLSGMSFAGINNTAALSHIKIEPTSEDYDDLIQRISEDENRSVVLDISEEGGSYSMHLSMAKDGPVKNSHLQRLGNALMEDFNNTRMNLLGIGDDQLQLIQKPAESKVTMTDINGDPIIEEDTSITSSEYWFVYGILFFVMMATMMTGSQVSTSIATEKSTRVVEYLLITVKPLALIVGKVLAMLISTMIQMLSMVAAMFVSNKISASLSPQSNSLLTQVLPKDMFQNINIFNIILCIILVCLGLVFYAVLAGLAGATVSKLEELNEGIMIFNIVALVGVYMGLGAANTLMGIGINTFVMFAFLFPLSSPFVLPGAILVGKASLPLIGIAIVLEVVFILLLFRFVAKVFETLILHNGNTIKAKQLFQLSKHSSK